MLRHLSVQCVHGFGWGVKGWWIFCKKVPLPRYCVISDSKSAIVAKTDTGMKKLRIWISLNTKHLTIQANEMGKDITIIWVPSHTNIQGNELEDKLAS